MQLVEKLITERNLSKEEYLELLNHWEDKELQEKLIQEALYQQNKYYGKNVAVAVPEMLVFPGK